jgi:hypothetical protein
VALVVAVSCFLPLAWNARALAFVVSTGLVLALSELALQVFLAARWQSENQIDADLLYRPVPGATREFNREPINGGQQIVYQINSSGFRGAELDPNPVARVVVYGDSYIHGYYSALENTFAQRLEHYVSMKVGVSIEVVNAGVAGYGPDQVLRKMEREFGILKPDLVLVAICTGNDFGDLVRNKLFRLDQGGQLLPNVFTIDPALQREMEVKRRESILKCVIRDAALSLGISVGYRPRPSADVRSMAPRERLEYFREQHLREYEEYVVQGNNVVRELAWDSYDADVSLTPNCDASRYKIRLMEGVVARMRATADEAGVPLVLIPIPHPLDVGGHPTGEVDRLKYPDYEPRGLVGILEAIAGRLGIPCVDLHTTFASRSVEALYFKGFDDHWSDAGQDLAAEVVASDLGSKGLLDGLVLRRSRVAQRNR